MRNVIVKAVGGSRLYGTNRNTSDLDIRGVYTESLQDVLFNAPETIEMQPDTVYHALRKFARLLIGNNPSALELLFTPDEYIIAKTRAWEHMQAIRTSVLSQRCIKTYGGFLTSQLRNFDKDSSDTKAVVHAYRLAEQLAQIVDTGTLQPVLTPYSRFIVHELYEKTRNPQTAIDLTQTLLEHAKSRAYTLPETPNELLIKETVTDIYRKDM